MTIGQPSGRRRGNGVAAIGQSDPDFMADADVFDVTRQPQAHLTFGHGIHQCLGHTRPARDVGRAAPSARFPTCLCRRTDLHFRGDGPVNGVRELPVRW